MKYLIILLVLSACASKPQQVASQVKVSQKAIDLNKVKTLEDLKAIVALTLPSNPVLNVREDSLEDSKKLESIKHLLKD